MAKYIVTGILLFIMIISVCLIWQTYKPYPNKKAPSVFRQFIFVIGCHALTVLLGITVFKDNLLLSNSSPFFLFYGLYFFLFIESITTSSLVKSKAVLYNKQFLIPSFFTSGYIFLALVSDKLSDQFIYAFFYTLFAFEGVLTVYYSVKTFSLLVSRTSLKDSLRLHFMAINTLLLFIGVVLVSFFILEFSYFSLYRMLLAIAVTGLMVYLMIIYRSLDQVFSESKCLEGKESNDFNFVGNSLSVNYVSVVAEEKIGVKPDTIEIEDNEKVKYFKSKIASELLTDYKNRINKTLIVQKLYLHPDFSLEDLSDITKISKHHLGQYFSSIHHSNFNKFINQLRIEYIISYIHNHKEVKLSVNDLLALSPFKSRASFFRNFKDFTGSAPSDYLKAYYESISQN
ncbi:MAG: helix-turn-helix domain-containing protein [Flavobacterium sp.]